MDNDALTPFWRDGWEGRTVLWRGAAYYIKRYYERRIDSKSNFIRAYYKKVEDVQSRFDPTQVARQAARDNGQQFLIYMTIPGGRYAGPPYGNR